MSINLHCDEEAIVKTTKLIGPALDWAVAKCEGYEVDHDFTLAGIFMPGWFVQMDSNYWKPFETYTPSTDWSQGGPIIEQERMQIDCFPLEKYASKENVSSKGVGNPFHGCGPTPLIAAMRCYVASKLGDEVNVPGELL